MTGAQPERSEDGGGVTRRHSFVMCSLYLFIFEHSTWNLKEQAKYILPKFDWLSMLCIFYGNAVGTSVYKVTIG